MRRPQDSNKQNETKERLGTRILAFFVRLIVPARVQEEFVGDLLEEWSSSIVPRLGKLRAFAWLCSQLIRSLVAMTCNLFQKQSIPRPVRMAAAVCLLLAVLHCCSVVFLVSTTPIAWFGLGKALLSIAAAIGLLNLRRGWRTFMVIVSGLSVLVLPFYVLATIYSTDFVSFASEMSGVDSVAVMLFAEVLGFAAMLFILICLLRADAKRAFDCGEPEIAAT